MTPALRALFDARAAALAAYDAAYAKADADALQAAQ